jgi:hypothetical protein
MKGIVIHHQNGINRAIDGKKGRGRLSVRLIEPVTASPQKRTGSPTFVFYKDERVIARSSKVVVMQGRRYPGVEHWFVFSETSLRAASPDTQQISSSV